jgi:hypothetical protein
MLAMPGVGKMLSMAGAGTMQPKTDKQQTYCNNAAHLNRILQSPSLSKSLTPQLHAILTTHIAIR